MVGCAYALREDRYGLSRRLSINAKNHQHLSEDIGRPKLKEHIALAEAGVSSRVFFGRKPGKAGHVWVEYPADKSTTHLWDLTQGLQLKSKDIIVEQQRRYPSNQQSVVLVTPMIPMP